MTAFDVAQLLGSLGEFLGAIAVVATLVYLAVQVRETRALVASQIHESSFALQAGYLQMVGGSEQLARVMVEGRRSPSKLSEAERLQFSSALSLGLNFVEHSHRQPYGQRSPAQAEDLQELVLYFLDNPGGRAYWAEYRGLFTSEFVAWVDPMLLADAGTAA